MGIKVVIVGKGLTGLVAAWQLLKGRTNDSISIDIICDGSGASPYVHGFNVPLHPDDSVDAFKKDTTDSGYGLSNPSLLNCLCEDSVFIPKMLEELQVFLEKQDGEYKLLKPLGSSFPRVTGSGNHTGAEIMNRIFTLLKEDNRVNFISNSRALKLDVENGKVKGVLLFERAEKSFRYIKADAVLLANGGFCGIYPFSTNSDDIGGDGIAMAYEAGATLTDMEFVQFEPSVALFPEGVRGKSVITTMFYEGAVLRNGKNERFMKPDGDEGVGECVGKDVLSKAIFSEMTNGTPTSHGGVYFDATKVGKGKLLDSYGSYVKRYESVGMDISKEPFEIAPGAHTSLGGVVIDSYCATNIEGLFAAGEVAGGLHGANRLGGNAGLETLVFGRRAAKGMCDYLESLNKQEEKDNDYDLTFGSDLPEISFNELSDIRKEMQKILGKDLFVVRNGNDLEKAVSSLEKMKEFLKVHSCGDKYEKIRLENDVICALLVAKSALLRKESVGCHYRSDSEDENSNYNLFIKKNEKGNIEIWRKNCNG